VGHRLPQRGAQPRLDGRPVGVAVAFPIGVGVLVRVGVGVVPPPAPLGSNSVTL